MLAFLFVCLTQSKYVLRIFVFCAAATVWEQTLGLDFNIKHVQLILPSSDRVTELGHAEDRL